jgi:hypothetical protein
MCRCFHRHAPELEAESAALREYLVGLFRFIEKLSFACEHCRLYAGWCDTCRGDLATKLAGDVSAIQAALAPGAGSALLERLRAAERVVETAKALLLFVAAIVEKP